MTNYAIHGKSSLVLDRIRIAKASKIELLHGIGHGADDKSNELVEPPSTTIKGQ